MVEPVIALMEHVKGQRRCIGVVIHLSRNISLKKRLESEALPMENEINSR